MYPKHPFFKGASAKSHRRLTGARVGMFEVKLYTPTPRPSRTHSSSGCFSPEYPCFFPSFVRICSKTGGGWQGWFCSLVGPAYNLALVSETNTCFHVDSQRNMIDKVGIWQFPEIPQNQNRPSSPSRSFGATYAGGRSLSAASPFSGGSHQQREEAYGADLLPLRREHDGLRQGRPGILFLRIFLAQGRGPVVW